MNDADLCAFLADETGKILYALQKSGAFADGKLGDEGDRRANAFLCEALHRLRPNDALLSEEEINCTLRCAVDRVWIIDPVDGTREYREGRKDWAVHVALAVGGVATAGAVALPGIGITLSSAHPPELRSAHDPLRMLVSRTRPAPEAIAVAGILGAELVPMGSAGAKAMAVVRGEADIYLHTGGQYEWDNCAPVAVAQAAGLHCSRVDGSPMRYNAPEPYLPDLLICRPELVADIMAALRA